MVKSYTGPAVDENWAHTQKGTKVSIPGSYWGSEYKNDKLPYKGVVLVYDRIRADGGPFFPVKLVCDKDNDVDYLLLWEKIVEYTDMTALNNETIARSVNCEQVGGVIYKNRNKAPVKMLCVKHHPHASNSLLKKAPPTVSKPSQLKHPSTPIPYFIGNCGCGCGLDTRAAKAKLGETKRGKMEWCPALLASPEVAKKHWYTPCKFGLFINCNLCNSHVKMRRPFDTNAWTSSGGHCDSLKTKKHIERVIARRAHDDYEERSRRKAAADGLVIISRKKPKGQASLRGFFINNVSPSRMSVSTGSSSTSVTSVSASVATGASSVSGLTTSVSGTNSHEESSIFSCGHKSRASSSVESLSGSVSQTSHGIKTCEGIIPSRCKLGNHVLQMKKYGSIVFGGKYVIKEFSDTHTYNLYARTCEGMGIPRSRKTCVGVRCDNCHTLWFKNSSRYKEVVQRRGGNFLTAIRLLNTPALSEEDEIMMDKFNRTPHQYVNEGSGRDLITMVKHRLEFYREAKVSYVVSTHLHLDRSPMFPFDHFLTRSFLCLVIENTRLSAGAWSC